MPRPSQRSSGIPPSDTREEPHHGCGRGRCSSQFWDPAIKIVGSQASGDITNGFFLCHDPCLWHIEEAIERESVGLYDQQ